MRRYLTAKEATDVLGITSATLYAYVSRGLIRSESIEDDSRIRRYNAEDVYKLRERKEQRKNPAKVAQQALHWGTPLLESALTLITDAGHYYRGYSAFALATNYSVEEVASLLWTGEFSQAELLFSVNSNPSVSKYTGVLKTLPEVPILQQLQIALTLASADDLAAYDLQSESVALAGARILKLMTAVLVDTPTPTGRIAESLSVHWSSAEGLPLLNAALILLADHELNISSFTARVVASGDANPYSVVIAGLTALQGIKHGGSTDRAEAMLREIGNPKNALRNISDRLRRGERIPGFGHPLYPEGDPRGKFLLNLLAKHVPDSPANALAQSIIEAVRSKIDLYANIDFALATLVRALDLPHGTGLALFALGRTLGWIGHAIEQYSLATMIRPRATYTGIPPRA
jgi:citrate synthase